MSKEKEMFVILAYPALNSCADKVPTLTGGLRQLDYFSYHYLVM